jgi:hypothetical protein
MCSVWAKRKDLLIFHFVAKGMEKVSDILFLSFCNLDNFVQRGHVPLYLKFPIYFRFIFLI